jgi:hypothetical protein
MNEFDLPDLAQVAPFRINSGARDSGLQHRKSGFWFLGTLGGT